MRFGRLQKQTEQVGVYDVVLLVDPKRFEQMMGIFFFVRIKLLDPFLDGGNDFLGIAFAEFNTSAMPDGRLAGLGNKMKAGLDLPNQHDGICINHIC